MGQYIFCLSVEPLDFADVYLLEQLFMNFVSLDSSAVVGIVLPCCRLQHFGFVCGGALLPVLPLPGAAHAVLHSVLQQVFHRVLHFSDFLV